MKRRNWRRPDSQGRTHIRRVVGDVEIAAGEDCQLSDAVVELAVGAGRVADGLRGLHDVDLQVETVHSCSLR